MKGLMPAEAFVARLRDEGARRYHDEHPFHRAMHEGRLSRAHLAAWVANRYYYQTRIPIKDALIVAKSEDPRFRRMWLHRIVDHDGATEGEGGLALWQALGRAVGIDEAELTGLGRVLPGVRFACDAYVQFVRDATLVEAVASSLTELFAPDIMQRRIAAWERHYPWIGSDALAYFRSRVPRASRDADEAVAFVVAQPRHERFWWHEPLHRSHPSPSWATSMPRARSQARSAESSTRSGLVLLTCTSHLSAVGSVASQAALPSSPPTGQWPIARACVAVRPVRISSSSLKKVPSKKTASASTTARSTAGVGPATDGNQATLRP